MQDWIFGKELEKDIAYSNHLEEFIERANINRLLKGLLKRTGLPGIRTAVAFTSTDFDPLRILALLSMYVCKLLKWGSSTSVEDLQASMLAFIDHATGRK